MLCLNMWWLKTSATHYLAFIRVLVMLRFLGFYHVSQEIFKTLDPQYNVLCVQNIIVSSELYVSQDASQVQQVLACSERLLYKATIKRDDSCTVSESNVFIIYLFILFGRFDVFAILKICFFMFLSCFFHIPCRFVTSCLQVFFMFFSCLSNFV